jgi:hypothetical protein
MIASEERMSIGNYICLPLAQSRRGNFCVGGIEQFCVACCAEHFCEDLAIVDGVVLIIGILDRGSTRFEFRYQAPIFRKPL